MNEAAPAPLSSPAFTGTPRPAFGIGPDGTYTRKGQALAFLCGLLTMALFFPLLFPGAILYSKAETAFPDDPDKARRLVGWSWLCVTLAPLTAAAVTYAVITGLRLHGVIE